MEDKQKRGLSHPAVAVNMDKRKARSFPLRHSGLMSFALVTDSSSDLAPEVAEKLGIHILPLRVVAGEHYYLDWLEFGPREALEALQRGESFQTFPPRHQAFEDIYRELLERHDFVVSIHTSAQLAGTLQQARRVVLEQRLGARVTVIDSGMTSMGLAETVLAVREALLAGADGDAAQAVAQRVRRDAVCQFTAPTLEYLRQFGQLTRAQEVMGNLLGMRPVLGFGDGRVRLYRTVRQNEVLEDMVSHLEDHFGDLRLSLAIVHSGSTAEQLPRMREAVEQSRLKVVRGRVQVVGAAVGTRLGPGGYGFSALPANTVERVLRESPAVAKRRLGRH